METITEQRTQKLFNLGTYPAFQPETKETVAYLQDLNARLGQLCFTRLLYHLKHNGLLLLQRRNVILSIDVTFLQLKIPQNSP